MEVGTGEVKDAPPGPSTKILERGKPKPTLATPESSVYVVANPPSFGDMGSNPKGDPNPTPATTESILPVVTNTPHNKI